MYTATDRIDRIVTDAFAVDRGFRMQGEETFASDQNLIVDCISVGFDVDGDNLANILLGLDLALKFFLVNLFAAVRVSSPLKRGCGIVSPSTRGQFLLPILRDCRD